MVGRTAFRGFVASLVLVAAVLAPTSAGAATKTCDGIPATKVGTPGDDTLIGTPDRDIIVGLGGNDIIDGLGGNDVICGYGGDDILYGRSGNDVLIGGTGNDILYGGSNNDTLMGLDDLDVLIPGPGLDTVDGGNGIDRVNYASAKSGVEVALIEGHEYGGSSLQAGYALGEGEDILVGIENITGSSFDDILTGDHGRNIIAGYNGDDLIIGLSGNDALRGNAGADWIDGGPGDDFIHGNRGIDVSDYYYATQSMHVNLGLGVAIGDGNDSLQAVELVWGSRFDDTLVGDNHANELVGDAGDDLIKGNGGNDYLRGGDGDDTLLGGSGTDEVYGGPGDDLLRGGSGADQVYGEDGHDVVVGNSGVDELHGGIGTDICMRGTSGSECEVFENPIVTTISSGLRVVHLEVDAGFYRNASSVAGCYWARLSGFGGDLDDIIANDFTYARAIVDIHSYDVGFESSYCGTWTSDLSPVTDHLEAGFGDGTYIVKWDIAPGLWRNSSSVDGCYWERLSGFGGELWYDVISNNFSYSQQVVEIYPSDIGFSAEGCGTWERIGD
jgi:hypothetical protein